MPNIKSAKDRVKTTQRDQARNKAVKSTVRTSLKNIDAALVEGNLENIDALYLETTKVLDKASTKGVIHKNKVSRTKSRLHKRIVKSKGE